MDRGIRLTSEQWDELDRLRMRTPSADVFRNCLIVLKSSMRETIASIASQMGCGTDTVVRVRRLYRQRGAVGLQPGRPTGRTSRATPEFIDQMKQVVATNPLTLGYGFSTWSATRLAEHLARVTRVHFSDDQMRRLLRRHGYSFQRPKHTLKGRRDEAAYEKAKEELSDLKKTPCPTTLPNLSSSRMRSRYIACPL
jgi:transposase